MNIMVKLVDNRQTKIIELPNFPWSKVEVYTKLTVWDQRQIASIEGDQFTKALHGIIRCIKDWNFSEDDEGKIKTPITLENLEKLGDEDLKVLLEAISGKTFDELQKIGGEILNSEEKKNKV